MTRLEFEQSISILKEVYGDKFYLDARVSTLYSSFENTNFSFWLKAIKNAINNNRLAPLEKELRESLDYIFSVEGISDFRKNTSDNFSGCEKCDFQGWFFITTIKDDHFTKKPLKGVAACECQKGEFLSKANKLVPWRSFKNKSSFFITTNKL